MHTTTGALDALPPFSSNPDSSTLPYQEPTHPLTGYASLLRPRTRALMCMHCSRDRKVSNFASSLSLVGMIEAGLQVGQGYVYHQEDHIRGAMFCIAALDCSLWHGKVCKACAPNICKLWTPNRRTHLGCTVLPQSQLCHALIYADIETRLTAGQQRTPIKHPWLQGSQVGHA